MLPLILAFKQILPVFLVVALGFALRRARLLREEFTRDLSRFVFYVLVPPLMFLGVAETKLEESFHPGLVFSTMLVVLLFSIMVFLVSRPWLPPSRLGVFTQGAARSNLVFMGLAILHNLYGDGILGEAAVFIAFHALLINLLSVMFLLLPHHNWNDRSGWARVAGQVVINPVIAGCALGMAFSSTGLALPETLRAALQTLARAALPLALLIVGASLYRAPLKGQGVPILSACLLKLIVLPALIFLLLGQLGVQGPQRMMAVVLLGAPTATISQIMAKEMEGDESLAAAIIMATTLLSALTLTIWITLIGKSA